LNIPGFSSQSYHFSEVKKPGFKENTKEEGSDGNKMTQTYTHCSQVLRTEIEPYFSDRDPDFTGGWAAGGGSGPSILVLLPGV